VFICALFGLLVIYLTGVFGTNMAFEGSYNVFSQSSLHFIRYLYLLDSNRVLIKSDVGVVNNIFQVEYSVIPLLFPQINGVKHDYLGRKSTARYSKIRKPLQARLDIAMCDF